MVCHQCATSSHLHVVTRTLLSVCVCVLTLRLSLAFSLGNTRKPSFNVDNRDSLMNSDMFISNVSEKRKNEVRSRDGHFQSLFSSALRSYYASKRVETHMTADLSLAPPFICRLHPIVDYMDLKRRDETWRKFVLVANNLKARPDARLREGGCWSPVSLRRTQRRADFWGFRARGRCAREGKTQAPR
jgi:hypothetical protein